MGVKERRAKRARAKVMERSYRCKACDALRVSGRSPRCFPKDLKCPVYGGVMIWADPDAEALLKRERSARRLQGVC